MSFYDCNGEIIFVTDEIRAKLPHKPNCESKAIRILKENEINSKWKHRKEEIVAVSGRVGIYDNHTWQLIVFNSKVQT